MLIVLACLAGGAGTGRADACFTAARQAERERGLPEGLLYAIALAESGRWNPETRQGYAWPWTVRAGAEAFVLDGPAEARRTVRRLKAQGRRNIDVGCAQVNLMYHPEAFADLEDAFDPLANLRYAADFLDRLRARTGSWTEAVAHYHSADPKRGPAYRDKVYRHLRTARATADAPAVPPPGGGAVNAGRGGIGVALHAAAATPAPAAPPRETAAAPAPPGGIRILRPRTLQPRAAGALWSKPLVIRLDGGGAASR